MRPLPPGEQRAAWYAPAPPELGDHSPSREKRICSFSLRSDLLAGSTLRRGGAQPPRGRSSRSPRSVDPPRSRGGFERPARTCRARRRVDTGPRSAASPRGPADRSLGPRRPAVARGRETRRRSSSMPTTRAPSGRQRPRARSAPERTFGAPTRPTAEVSRRARGRSTSPGLHPSALAGRPITSALAECRDTLPPVVDPP